MNDRELLEMAAKAAGYTAFEGQAAQLVDSGWNPRDDDGEAFRLALRVPHLNLQWVIAEAFQAFPDNNEARETYARLTIVEFAAKFGKAM